MLDQKKLTSPSYLQLTDYYSKHFSLGYINSDINVKFALISLIGYIVTELKKKNPDVTFYTTVHKLAEGSGIPEELEYAIAIIAEDFAYQCKTFPTFGMQPSQMVAKIKEILNLYMPF